MLGQALRRSQLLYGGVRQHRAILRESRPAHSPDAHVPGGGIMTSFDAVEMKITKGDVITSKKGILSGSPLTGKFYIWKKAEYLGNGHWRVIGDKEEVDVEVTKR